MDVGDRVGLGLVRLEYRLEARDPQHVVDLRRDRADLQRPSSVLRARQIAGDQAQAAAVDELDGSEVKQDVLALPEGGGPDTPEATWTLHLPQSGRCR